MSLDPSRRDSTGTAASPAPPSDPIGTAPEPSAGGTAPRAAVDWRLKFLLLALVWGTSFMFIGISGQYLEPVQITLGRMLTGVVPLAGFLLLSGSRLPRGARIWFHLSVTAFIVNLVPFTFYGYAGQLIPSAVSGIVNAATPLFVVLFSLLLLPDERPTRTRTAGLLVGFLGVLVVFGVWTGFAGASAAGLLMALGATVGYGIGTPYLRRFVAGSGYSSLELVTAQLLTGTVQIAVVALVFTDAPQELPPHAVAAVTALGVFGTGAAFLLQYGVIREAGVTVASTVTYLAPIVAIGAGVLLMGEHLAWNQPVGALVVIAGAALAQHHRRTGAQPPGAAGGAPAGTRAPGR
ncbi:DMT family transporter [Streptomonospora salina]|uniref:Drug/metabolite transporter (DMT)-like permease n=1 Tax=Streptomonospora salina TaxID=104205 RepID=A0A841ECC0_9ACTN|nr:DMT family transporter [Streptomonospora salina]MBB5998648.1 drug/metabolite transporter (DMT)-like permease [Streptomonospora salina]